MFVRNLFVLSDSSCELCRRCKRWLAWQRQLVPMTFIEANSADAHRVFPVLDHEHTLQELTVISDVGGVYTGEKAWLMCLWALSDYRGWACTMSTPERLPIAKKFVTMISENRKSISKLIPVSRG